MEPRGPRLQRNGYRDIVDALKERISTGQIPAGNYLGTEKDLQQEFGAARSTVRKVLAELIRLGWAQAVPSKGVFAARGLSPVASNVIAWVENGSYVQKILGEQFTVRLKAEGYELLKIGGTDLYPLEYALQQVLDGGFAGALVWCFHAYPNPALVAELSQTIPVVALDHRMGKAETDLVEFDHEAAAYDLTTHLIEQGCQRIGITGMLDTLDSTVARIQGYMRAMFDNDLNPNPADFVFIETSNGQRDASLLEMRLRSSGRPDGLVILQDSCSADVVKSALRCGLFLPDDLKLAAIGSDYEVTCNGLGMTSISFHWEDLVDKAMDLLMSRFSDLHQPSQRSKAGHSLVIRGLSLDTCSSIQSVDFGAQTQSALPSRPAYHFSSSWSLLGKGAAPDDEHQSIR